MGDFYYDKNKYDVSKLSLKKKREIILKAKEVCFNWWADKLQDPEVRRQRIDMSFEDMMKKLTKDCHFTIIHRNHPMENCIEVAFNTFGPINYFLWIKVGMEHAAMFEHLKAKMK